MIIADPLSLYEEETPRPQAPTSDMNASMEIY